VTRKNRPEIRLRQELPYGQTEMPARVAVDRMFAKLVDVVKGQKITSQPADRVLPAG